jgi:glycosyltransferase involved in cell wall biosynthesis
MTASLPPTGRTILILSNVARTLTRFRGHLIQQLANSGYAVICCAGEEDAEVTRTLSEWGVQFIPVRLGRTGMNPLAEFAALVELVLLMRRLRPDIFLGYTIKPVVYGLPAARLAGVPHRFAMITGLGYAFTEGSELKRRIARTVARVAYGASLRVARGVIFQNPDDQAYFLGTGLLRDRERAALVAGSGVDLDYYPPAPLPATPVRFLMIARVLRDKGVYEFAEAARMVKRRFPDARIVLVGRLDSNPAAINATEVEAWVREGVLEYRGELKDVRPEIAACHVYVLPSYREGMPRTVLEAMAMGRPIITTDVPGCRETVVHGKNGFLISPRNADALADAMMRMAGDPSFLATAAEASLALVRERFEVGAVSAAVVKVLEGVEHCAVRPTPVHISQDE